MSGIEKYHAEPIVLGDTYDEAEAEARRIEREEGLKCVSPYNDPDIISGTGMVTYEQWKKGKNKMKKFNNRLL